MNLIKRPDLYFSIIKIASVARFLRIMRREGNLYESDTYFAIIVKKSLNFCQWHVVKVYLIVVG